MFWSRKKRENFAKKGQFTLFVLVGLVIFFIFSFAIFSKLQLANAQLNIEADRQIKSYLDTNSINQYVTSCLDAVSSEVITRAMIQGGTLNFSNKIYGTEYIEYKDEIYNRTINITLAATPNFNCPDGRDESSYVITHSPGDYPYRCGNVQLGALETTYKIFGHSICKNNCTLNDFKKYSGFFGINKLPVLCDYYGENSINYEYTPNNKISCDYYAFDNSLQKEIEKEIESEMNKCVDFKEILSRSPSNISMNGNVSAKILFSDEGFRIKLEYPFTIVMFKKEPITRMVEFDVEKNIPFKQLYEFVFELVNKEVQDIFFDVLMNENGQVNNDVIELTSKSNRRYGNKIYTSNYIIDIKRGDFTNNYTDILTVVDFDNKILDKPILMNFAIHNRRPALEYMHKTSNPLFDISAMENETIILTPQGYDPDSEELTYEYNFWKEDYDQYYNLDDSKCTTPTSLEYIIANCSIINSSSLYSKNWTNSALFKTTKQNASYFVKKNDRGYHIVKISIFDREGLRDFQDVRILVFDMPEANITIPKIYDDIPEGYATYEDLFILDGAGSKLGVIASGTGATFSSFNWTDKEEPFSKIIEIKSENDKKLFIPQNLTTTPITMENIPNLIFVKKSDNSYNSKIHEIILTVNTTMGMTSSTSIKINVTRCVNHSSTNPPYPYNNNPFDLTDSLQANHVCCTNDYTYETTNVECYRNETVSSFYGLKDFDNPDIYPSTPTVGSTAFPKYERTIKDKGGVLINSFENNKYYSNDIFTQTFTRKCSGNRGNTCTGDITEIIEVKNPRDECDDTNKVTNTKFQDEKCSGPKVTELRGEYVWETGSQAQCVNYEKEFSFETYLYKIEGIDQGTKSDGICTTEKQWASGEGIEKFTTGTKNYLCDGQCGGHGECNYATSCKCQVSDATNPNSKTHQLCAGLKPGDHEPAAPTCNGDPFIDICSNCELKNSITDTKCKSSNSANGCTADAECDNRYPNTQGTKSASGDTTKGCNSMCVEKSCGNYKYDTALGNCKTSCNSRSDCSLNTDCNVISDACELTTYTVCYNSVTNIYDDTICTTTYGSQLYECSTSSGTCLRKSS